METDAVKILKKRYGKWARLKKRVGWFVEKFIAGPIIVICMLIIVAYVLIFG